MTLQEKGSVYDMINNRNAEVFKKVPKKILFFLKREHRFHLTLQMVYCAKTSRRCPSGSASSSRGKKLY
jgi:hypothetical protein